jgi:cullin 3
VEAHHYFSQSTAPDYIRKVFKRLEEERERVDRCLDESTKQKIEDVIKREMLINYKQQLLEKENTGCISCRRDWKIEDLRLFYECLHLIDDIPAIVSLLKEDLMSSGAKFVMDTENITQPLLVIEGVLEMRARYTELLTRAFYTIDTTGRVQRDSAFEAAFDKAFEEICNKNQRFPEYLSFYVDSKMRKGKAQISDQELDTIFDDVLTLFRYLREKDVFEKYYKNHLARRLLGQKSTSDDAERAFIAKLKTEYGYQFTSKLEGMFQDMKGSQETQALYKQHLIKFDKRLPCDMVVQVLTTTYWPVTATVEIILPPEVEASADDFKNFYLGSHSGRKLQYQYNMGTADVRLRMPNKVYELNVSTHQMAILLCFNGRDTVTFSDLCGMTNINLIELKRCLRSLCYVPPKQAYTALLLMDGGGGCSSSSTTIAATTSSSATNQIDEDTHFTFNEDFKSKMVKVKVCQGVVRETEDDAKGVRAKVSDDRKFQLDAVIVRVMKTRKTLEHRMLVMEVTRLLSGRFAPSPDDIKKRIEDLIDREYLERSSESRSKYNYLA